MVDRFKNWNEYIDPRIEELTDKGFYLEAFYLFSITVEHILKESIRYQEEWIQIVLKKSKIKFEKTKTEGKPLGFLIGLFAKYYTDTALVSKLSSFNITRNKITHKLMDHPISQLNNEAKNKTFLYYELISEISSYNVKILGKTIGAHKRRISKIRN
jgi:hypothetical protein